METEEFKKYLKKKGKASSVTDRIIEMTGVFEDFLSEKRKGINIDDARPADLEEFLEWDSENLTSTKGHLWALVNYYKYKDNHRMYTRTVELRKGRVKRRPLKLKKIVGVDRKHIEQLEKIGIKDVEGMLKEGATRRGRKEIAERTGLQEKVLLEYAKLSDLSRIPGVKGISARLYHDAGIYTIEKMAKRDPVKIRKIVMDYIDKSGFDGIPPTTGEVEFTVESAKKLPVVLET